ncbi:uncharacterized protein LOC115071394 [Nannospalax galili]|uniref:uncharacterized protein LOC115071394 n=1 Tax=Nannospalax galili TaxID=1026970 RepID=UPI00111C4E9E|nr:uncharacterized protein LOC115071394 [Nannospalax galili]
MEGRELLKVYRQTLGGGGLRAAARWPTNFSKVSQVIQEKTEAPWAYLECLLEAYRTYTPLDPEAPENQMVVSMAFVNQAAPDIKKKLQPLEGFEGMIRTEDSVASSLGLGYNKYSRTLPSSLTRPSTRTYMSTVPPTQYVDDLLLAAQDEISCERATRDLLQALDQLGYKVSAKKAQLCTSQVTYLDYILKEGQRWLSPACKQTILGIPTPKSRRHLWEFLGLAGFYTLWIPGFSQTLI